MDRRRELGFDRLDEVMPEVEHLLKGHTTSGLWSLGQILYHLASSIQLTLRDGSTTELVTLDPELIRTHEIRRRRFFKVARLPEGAKVPYEVLIPPPDRDDQAEAARLRSTLEAFESYSGSMEAHPYLGPLAKSEWADFHRLHCAHHLSFVWPIG